MYVSTLTHADRHMAWKKMYKTPSFEKYFTELEPTHQLRKLPTTFDGVVDRMLSKSYVSVLPDEQKERLVQDAHRILSAPDSETGREWIDQEAGVFVYPYGTGRLRLLTRQTCTSTGAKPRRADRAASLRICVCSVSRCRWPAPRS